MRSKNKQYRDLAFAVALLKSGAANLRALAGATEGWTTFGNIDLSDHLLSTHTITQHQKEHAERHSHRTLAALDAGETPSGPRHSASSRERLDLAQLDQDGKVAKLLGMADASVMADEDVEDRQVASRYTLLRKLGQGGLGVVWLARDQNLQRYVAVKEISREVDQGDPALVHFRREAEITGRLEHPGIVPVYQYGEDPATGKSFYAMRFLGKKTLQDAIDEYHERREVGNADPMMLHRLLSALISVCHAMAHAHSKDVVHRDLKPENVALDEFGQVTLLDWGLAKVNDATGMYDVNGRTEPGDLHSAGSTQVGRVLGTPLYMAPEQAAGRLDEVDELTDGFALGGILYAILTGLAPHQTAIETASSHEQRTDIMSTIVSGRITPPREVVPSVPPELNAVCMKALSAKRYLRYESAEALSEEIQRFMAGSPVDAYRPPWKHRLRRWMANHPTLTQTLLLLASLLLISTAAVGLTIRQARMTVQQERYASLQELVRELEVHLAFETQNMIRNLQFMSELPLMDAIVISQQRAGDIEFPTDAVTNAADDPGTEDSSLRRESAIAYSDAFGHLAPAEIRAMSQISPEEWLNRQGNVFDGLLRANPAYLVAVVCRRNDDGSLGELVRSERVAAGRTVYRVPPKQLTQGIAAATAPEEAQVLQSMRPGEVVLITNDQLSEDIPTNSRSPLVLSGVQPIFASDGDLFGLNIIELDLRTRLQDLFAMVGPDNVHTCVTDAHGHVVLRSDDRRWALADGTSITETFPQLTPFFATPSLAKDNARQEFGDGRTIFARRVHLGDSSKAQIGIVAYTLATSALATSAPATSAAEAPLR